MIDLHQTHISRGLKFAVSPLLLLVVVMITHVRAADTLDFAGRLGRIAPENQFGEPGYYVWCGSGIRGEDGKYYLFYSRWKTGSEGRAPGDEQLFKDMRGWLKYCEIAAAVSDSPTGPFKHVATVITGTGDTNRWDCFNAHNPHIQRFNGKIYLYYIANNPVSHKDRWMQHADGQRIGVAVADSVQDMIASKFQRSATPIMSPDGTNTFCRAVNPGVTQGRDGRYLMMFKSRSAPTGGFMTHWIAAADKPDGPFKLVGPALTDSRYDAEDPYFWYDRKRDRYYAIVKDFSHKERVLSPQFGALALVTSENGWGDWQPAAHNLVSLREFTDIEGRKHPLANLERPQLLFDEHGEPVCLYAAAGEKDPFQGTPSFNLTFPIHEPATHAIPYFLRDRAAVYQKSPREAALAWFGDARLGMFIHWGVWGKHHAAWAMFNQKIPLAEYQQMAREVDASGFDAKEIVKLAGDSGMRYITFVAKHHDGFCLWDSKATDWDSMDYPMHRDFVGELARACHERGMPLFIYYSIGIDWTHPYYLPKELYSVGRPGYAQTPDHFKYRQPEDFEKYREFCKQQLSELCTNYGPIAGFWFDTLGGVLANSEMFKMQEFYDLIHQRQPHALVLFKTGATGTEDVLVGERELKSIAMHYGNKSPQDQRIRRLADDAWSRNFQKKAEIAVTSQGTWEWSPASRCQNADALWKMLVGAADNNANLLLNFGPKPDGSIPEDVAANFRLLGDRIHKEGYPALNRTNHLDLRKKGAGVDKTEKEKTAR